MIDARTLLPEKSIETDICIVGAGVAGISLAREFIKAKNRVCILESGGAHLTEKPNLSIGGKILVFHIMNWINRVPAYWGERAIFGIFRSATTNWGSA